MPPNPHRLPADARYGVDDTPPTLTTWVQAVQHLGLVAINFIFVLVGDFDPVETQAQVKAAFGDWTSKAKYARLASWIMSRPQIQEEAVVQLADLLQEKMQPDGLAVIMEADHFCMQWRGVKDMDARMINSVMHGSFLKDPALRREFLSLIKR